MAKEFVEGERILIVLNTGENFEGDYVRGSGSRIEIENIHHYESGNKFETRWIFYKGEIKSVLRLHTNKIEESQETDKNNDKILIPREEYDRLKRVTDDFITITTDDKTYFNSIEKLSNFDSLGVVASNCERGQNGRIKMLALSTWKQVYIFDFHNFRSKRFPKELAEIFQSHYIQKIVFNGGPLVDCLLNTYRIQMNNIYDIQISHLLIMKNKTGKCEENLPTIGSCLTEYFNFSPSFMTTALDILKDSWEFHPVDVDKLKKISRLVTYLISLKEHQMSLMMKDYHKAVLAYNNLFTKANDYHLLEMTENRKLLKSIDDIIPSSLLESNSLKNVKYE